MKAGLSRPAPILKHLTLLMLLMLPAAALPWGLAQSTTDPQAVMDAAVRDFETGRIEEAAAGFDRLAELRPDILPRLWQRGIALYYAGRYEDCRRQFELHRTVNPSDVENAVWHFLCVAKLESPEAAREALLPVGADPRPIMPEVYEMFAGRLAPDQLLGSDLTPQSEFYAHLYLGLYFEALGDADRALEEIGIAADDAYAAAGGYMHTVARVHLDLARP